jgi:hypothetical protein
LPEYVPPGHFYSQVLRKNVIYFRLHSPSLIDPLRFDPAAHPGNYIVESIMARATPILQLRREHCLHQLRVLSSCCDGGTTALAHQLNLHCRSQIKLDEVLS